MVQAANPKGCAKSKGRFAKPISAAGTASATSGPAMLQGLSCGCPWPRYSPKKMRNMARVM